MTLGVRTKLFLLSVGLIAICLVVSDLYLTSALQNQLAAQIRQDLGVRLQLVQRAASVPIAPLTDTAAWDNVADDLGRRAGARVTLVRKDGVVVGDSELSLADIATVENHARRPEVIDALARGYGASERHSSTRRDRLLYAAIPWQLDNSIVGVVRVSMPLTQIDNTIDQFRWVLAGGFLVSLVVAFVLSGLASHWAARRTRSLTAVARDMANGDLSARSGETGTDEFADLGRALDRLVLNLSLSLSQAREERDLLQDVLEGMREGLMLVGDDGCVKMVNPALREMLLIGPDIIGRPLLDVVRNADLKVLVELTSTRREASSAEIETTGPKPRRLLAHASAGLIGDGSVLVVLVDVTDIRRLEALRRDFVANASHELRTPVASASSALETVRTALQSDPAAVGDFLDIVERNLQRLTRLVSDLLDLSRIEARQYRMSAHPVSVADITAHVISSLRNKAAERSVVLGPAQLDPDLTVRADAQALEQVLTNLVDNAIQYGPPETVVTVHAERQGPLVQISVADTGTGIESKHLPRLFERFYRVDPGRSRQLGGTGLGLSIVKHLVEAMGGTVGVKSAPGQGSAFSFTVPSILP